MSENIKTALVYFVSTLKHLETRENKQIWDFEKSDLKIVIFITFLLKSDAELQIWTQMIQEARTFFFYDFQYPFRQQKKLEIH